MQPERYGCVYRQTLRSSTDIIMKYLHRHNAELGPVTALCEHLVITDACILATLCKRQRTTHGTGQPSPTQAGGFAK